MELTVLSNKEYNNLLARNMDYEEAYEYITSKIEIRKFSETLAAYSPVKDVKTLLTNKLSEYSRSGKRDSIARKVRDWLNDKYEPSDRETYFQICFAFGLDEIKAQNFLCSSLDGGIHYRNPKEITYAFALRIGMDYNEAAELYNGLPKAEANKSVGRVYTKQLAEEFKAVSSVSEFKEFYIDHLADFGALHNSAYDKFMLLYNCIARPDEDLRDTVKASRDEVWTAETVMSEYLQMNVPSDKKTKDYTYVQKLIKSCWPNATMLKEMRSRARDIDRKTLLLLYLVTEGITSEEEDVFFDDIYDELTPEEQFREQYDRINVMLVDCGFSTLDPRNIFDWLIMYTIKNYSAKDDADAYMTDDLKIMLDKIFEETNGK